MKTAIDQRADSRDSAKALRARIAEKFSVAVMVDSILAAYQQARMPLAERLTSQPFASNRAA